MKKNSIVIFIILYLCTFCIQNITAQSNRLRTISTTVSTSEVSRGSQILSFDRDGIWVYVDIDVFGRDEKNIYYGGAYYIDSSNTIHLVRENGYEETATLRYDNAGKSIIYYKGNYYYQSYYERLDEIYTWKVQTK